MLDLDEIQSIKDSIEHFKGSGKPICQVLEEMQTQEMIQALEFLSDQLDSLCHCEKLEIGTCRPCKALSLVWGEYEPLVMPE